jgi:hypothetical protein
MLNGFMWLELSPSGSFLRKVLLFSMNRVRNACSDPKFFPRGGIRFFFRNCTKYASLFEEEL